MASPFIELDVGGRVVKLTNPDKVLFPKARKTKRDLAEYYVAVEEAMACGIPVAATATEPVRWMLGGRTAHLAEPGDGAGLSSCISGLLDAPQADYGLLRDWAHSARLFDAQLRA